ncbi:MAG TPA: class F sortase [Candidatus Saccharimonadales bacterium]|nr:class F sortase [Candidatus Saccharimonadales bacterium]
MLGIKKPLADKAKVLAKRSISYFNRSSARKDHTRARRWQVRFSKIRFSVSVRRFRTKPNNRSKLLAQIVLPLYFMPFREISFSGIKRRSRLNIIQQSVNNSKYFSQINPASLIIIMAGVAGMFVFGPSVYGVARININTADTGAIKSSTIVTPAVPLSMPSSTPVEIQIPSIEVDASVFPDGLQPDGSLTPPSDYTTTGWYTGSPTPGSIGASVIVGHVDHVGGIGVFWDLRLLQPGDEIDVVRADGTTARFKVDALREYPQNSFPTQLVYGNVDYAGLRLITCGGVFSEQTHHYSNNIVIYGSLI